MNDLREAIIVSLGARLRAIGPSTFDTPFCVAAERALAETLWEFGLQDPKSVHGPSVVARADLAQYGIEIQPVSTTPTTGTLYPDGRFTLRADDGGPLERVLVTGMDIDAAVDMNDRRATERQAHGERVALRWVDPPQDGVVLACAAPQTARRDRLLARIVGVLYRTGAIDDDGLAALLRDHEGS